MSRLYGGGVGSPDVHGLSVKLHATTIAPIKRYVQHA